MKNYIPDLLRQTEILALVMDSSLYSKADLAEMFSVTEITINRDLNTLRKKGFPVYSKNGKVRLLNRAASELLIDIASDYLPLKLNSDLFNKQISAIIGRTDDTFKNLILLAKAVNEGIILEIEYQRLSDDKVFNYRLHPVKLQYNDLNWHLHAVKEHEKIVKTFYVSRISKVNLTGEKITPTETPEESGDAYEIVLRFDKKVKSQVYGKLWFDDFSLCEEPSENILMTSRQPITSRLAAWCISWWDMIEVVSPPELKSFISEMIKDFQSVNKTI